MALTKVTGSVIKDSVSLSGNVSVGGTLTYQDVTNVDALGIGTFRTGIKVLAGQVDVGSNIKLGNAGIITATTFIGNLTGNPTGSGANLTNLPAANLTGTLPAISGANLTNLPAPAITAINNASDNRIVTSNGGTTVNAEELLTYDGSELSLPKAKFSTTAPLSFISNGATGTFNKTVVYANYNNTSNHAYNGILFDMGHLTDSAAGEVRKFTIGERGGPTNVTFDQNGIHFGHGSGNPTLNANTGLDDYEEGTYTPAITYDSADSGNKSYQARHGTYTKIGRVVTANFYVELNNRGTGNGAVAVSLPFTVGSYLNSTSLEAGGVIHYFTGLVNSWSDITLSALDGLARCRCYGIGGQYSNASSAFEYSALANTFNIRGSITYQST